MPKMNFSKGLSDEYQRLFDTCITLEDKSTQVESILSRIGENQDKYVADGRWSDTAVSKQAGAAILLRRMAEKGSIEFILPTPIGPEETLPPIRYSSSEKSTYAGELQSFLNKFPNIYVKVDGYPGDKTSEAFKKVTGYYLYGDPRTET